MLLNNSHMYDLQNIDVILKEANELINEIEIELDDENVECLPTPNIIDNQPEMDI